MMILETLMSRLVVRRREPALPAPTLPSRPARDRDDEYGAPESMLPAAVIESLRAADAQRRVMARPAGR